MHFFTFNTVLVQCWMWKSACWIFELKNARWNIEIHSDMFRIICDPTSGSIELYLTEIRSGSLMFVVCLVGVWQRNFEPVAPYTLTHTHTHTHTTGSKFTSVNHYEFQSSTALYSLMMDGIRSETCRSDF